MSTYNPRGPYRRRPRRYREPRGEQGRGPRPRPMGDKCSPLCPYFRCQKNALRIEVQQYKGRPIKVPMCAWIGDKCIGAQCRFAYCELRAMLPDGRCRFAVMAKAKKEKSFEDELMEMDKEFDLEDRF